MTTSETPAPWWVQLEQSVEALEAAALEWRGAVDAARLLRASVDPERVRVRPGRVTLAGRSFERAPQERALADIGRVYLDLLTRAQARYERAALTYAFGASWAVDQLQWGRRQPTQVVLYADEAGQHDRPRPLRVRDADHVPGAQERAAAWEALMQCVYADDVATELAERAALTAAETEAMRSANATAAGLADAAARYGDLAQDVLRALLDAEHERHLAAEPDRASP